jgi:hypothetical protein
MADLLARAHERGHLSYSTLRNSGLVSVNAVAAELRRRGYEVEVVDAMELVVITKYPAEGAAERAKDQTSLFDIPGTTHVPRHGWGDDPE